MARTIVQRPADLPTEMTACLDTLATQLVPQCGLLTKPAGHVISELRRVQHHQAVVLGELASAMSDAQIGVTAAQDAVASKARGIPGDARDFAASLAGEKDKIANAATSKIVAAVLDGNTGRTVSIADRAVAAIQAFDVEFARHVDRVVQDMAMRNASMEELLRLNREVQHWMSKADPLGEGESYLARLKQRGDTEEAEHIECILRELIVRVLAESPAKLAAQRGNTQPRVGEEDPRSKALRLRAVLENERRDPGRWPEWLRASRTFRMDLRPVFSWLLGWDGALTSTSTRIAKQPGDLDVAPNWPLRAAPMLIREFNPSMVPAFMKLQRRSA